MNESAEKSIERILKGDFTIGDEQDLVENIRKKLSLPLTHEQIINILMEGMDEELTMEQSKETLISA